METFQPLDNNSISTPVVSDNVGNVLPPFVEDGFNLPFVNETVHSVHPNIESVEHAMATESPSLSYSPESTTAESSNLGFACESASLDAPCPPEPSPQAFQNVAAPPLSNVVRPAGSVFAAVEIPGPGSLPYVVRTALMPSCFGFAMLLRP